MKLVNLHQDVAVNVLPDRPLAARLVRDQRLQHRADLELGHKRFVDEAV